MLIDKETLTAISGGALSNDTLTWLNNSEYHYLKRMAIIGTFAMVSISIQQLGWVDFGDEK